MNLAIAMVIAYVPFFIGVIQLAREENKGERDQLHHKRVRWTDTEN
jgi:hypothetical protein